MLGLPPQAYARGCLMTFYSLDVTRLAKRMTRPKEETIEQPLDDDIDILVPTHSPLLLPEHT
jgi:hypothetical protein